MLATSRIHLSPLLAGRSCYSTLSNAEKVDAKKQLKGFELPPNFNAVFKEIPPEKLPRFMKRRYGQTLRDLQVQKPRQQNLNAFITRSPTGDHPLRLLEQVQSWIAAAKNTPLEGNSHTRRLSEARRLPWDQCRVAIKDNISYVGLPTSCASNILHRHMSPYNASVVENLEGQGGAIIMGKTNMDEFGMGSHSTNSRYGEVENPWPAGHSAGGSSGGSAVAVVTRHCHFALGTDTGGSVRLPAAYTGAIGFKPSYGKFSRWGLIPYANSLDTVGVLFRDAPELKKPERPLSNIGILLNLMRTEDTGHSDPTLLGQSSRERLNSRPELERSERPIRVGVPVEYNTHELSAEVRSAWQKVLEGLQHKGFEIVPISLPSTKHALSAYYIIAAAEASSNLAKYDGVRYGQRNQESDGEGGVLYAVTRKRGLGTEARRRILLGSYTLSSQAIDNYFIQAQKIRRLVQQDFDRVFALPSGLQDPKPIDLSELDEDIALEDKTGPAQVDIIICPTAPTTAPRLSDVKKSGTRVKAYMNDVFTVPASLAGLPAVSVPVYSSSGHHVGIQLIGQYYDDDFVLEMAQEVAA